MFSQPDFRCFDGPALRGRRRQPVAHVRIGEHGGHVCRRAVAQRARHRCAGAAPRARTSRRRRCIRRTATDPPAPKRARHSSHRFFDARDFRRAFRDWARSGGRWRAHSWAIVNAGSQNPECISAHTARAMARASRSCGPAAARELAGVFADGQRIPDAAASRAAAPARAASGSMAAMSRANSGVSSGITRSANVEARRVS